MILNNVVVSMVPYCAQKLLGQCVLDLKGTSIESRLMSIQIPTYKLTIVKIVVGGGPDNAELLSSLKLLKGRGALEAQHQSVSNIQ